MGSCEWTGEAEKPGRLLFSPDGPHEQIEARNTPHSLWESGCRYDFQGVKSATNRPRGERREEIQTDL